MREFTKEITVEEVVTFMNKIKSEALELANTDTEKAWYKMWEMQNHPVTVGLVPQTGMLPYSFGHLNNKTSMTMYINDVFLPEKVIKKRLKIVNRLIKEDKLYEKSI